jgi:hypothetical protein
MTEARVHDPIKGEWTTWAPLAARGPVWPRAGVWFYRALTYNRLRQSGETEEDAGGKVIDRLRDVVCAEAKETLFFLGTSQPILIFSPS